jgi:hypothetical protein
MTLVISGDHSVIPPVIGKVDPGDRSGVDVRRKPKANDTLEVSRTARHLNADGTTGGAPTRGTPDLKGGASKIRAEIQERIRNGFYEKDEVLSQIAERILDLFGF